MSVPLWWPCVVRTPLAEAAFNPAALDEQQDKRIVFGCRGHGVHLRFAFSHALMALVRLSNK